MPLTKPVNTKKYDSQILKYFLFKHQLAINFYKHLFLPFPLLLAKKIVG